MILLASVMPHKTQCHEQVGDDFRISMVGSNSIVANEKTPGSRQGSIFRSKNYRSIFTFVGRPADHLAGRVNSRSMSIRENMRQGVLKHIRCRSVSIWEQTTGLVHGAADSGVWCMA